MTDTELLNTFERIRLEKGLNVTDFATLLGVSYDTYYRWKRGEHPKTMTAVLKMLNFCKEENIL